MVCWKNCAWLDGNAGKINIGTHLEGWWTGGGIVAFGVCDFDGKVDVDFRTQGAKMDEGGEIGFRIVDVGEATVANLNANFDFSLVCKSCTSDLGIHMVLDFLCFCDILECIASM